MAARSLAEAAPAGAETRTLILSEARAWLGTPYCHQASCRGAGTDCLGLIRGVWRAVYGAEPETPPAYTPDWAEYDGAETLMAAAARHLVALGEAEAAAGDLLLFRMRRAGPAKHVGILSTPRLAPGRLIHAYSRGTVTETHLTEPWLARLAGVFRFPERTD